MKKFLSIVVLILAAMSIAIPAVQAEELSFALSSNAPATFWTHARAGTVIAEQELGVQVEFYMPPGGSVEEQKRFVETMLAKGVDGIALSVIDPENMTPFLNEIVAEVPLVLTDSDAPNSNRLAYVGMSNYAAGRMAGEAIKGQLPDGGEIGIFVGMIDAQNAIERRQGIIDELKGLPYAAQYPGEMTPAEPNIQAGKWVILDTRTDNVDESRAKANAEDLLVKNPGVDLMIGLWGYNTPAIISALGDAEKLGEIKIVGFDEDVTVLQGIKDGYVAGTVVQNPFEYGRKSIEVLYKLAKGEDAGIPEDKLIDVPARYITKDQVDEFMVTIEKQLKIGETNAQK